MPRKPETRENPTRGRWDGVMRTWSADEVARLRSGLAVEHTLARHGAMRLWEQLQGDGPVTALGAMTGQQAVQQVRAGLRAVYASGWQVAADANLAGGTYPDQGLYPVNSVPALVARIHAALARADQVERLEGNVTRDWFVPVVADAEAGFGGALNAAELVRQLIAAGAAGIHLEDQLAGEKKCGHLGGKVLVPTSQFERTLRAARLAADLCDVPTVIIARTDADGATLLTSDVDPRDRPFLTGERSPEGHHAVRGGVDAAIARACAYAPWADVLWWETKTPDLKEARRFAEAVHRAHPGKLLAYNCSPSFRWRAHLDAARLRDFQRELGAMGYRFQFVTLAGFHSLAHGMFSLARDYAERGMAAYSELQEAEIASESDGYTAVRHQREVGTPWFDAVAGLVAGEDGLSTCAMEGSTELDQFTAPRRRGRVRAAKVAQEAAPRNDTRVRATPQVADAVPRAVGPTPRAAAVSSTRAGARQAEEPARSVVPPAKKPRRTVGASVPEAVPVVAAPAPVVSAPKGRRKGTKG
jgi:isocitrate lyase